GRRPGADRGEGPDLRVGDLGGRLTPSGESGGGPMRRILVGLLGSLLIGAAASGEDARPIRVVVWDEQQPQQKAAYENFLGNQIAGPLAGRPGLVVKSVRLDDPDQGLPAQTLDDCDVLIWWGHVRNGEVKPELARRVVDRIKAGKLSLIV